MVKDGQEAMSKGGGGRDALRGRFRGCACAASVAL